MSPVTDYDVLDTQLLRNIYDFLKKWQSDNSITADTHVGQFIPLLQGFVYDLEYGQHYAAWPESDGYHIVVAGDIQFVSMLGNISILADDVVRYSVLDFNYDSAASPTLVVSNPGTVSGSTASTALIFSDVGNYPRLVERGVSIHVEATFVILLACALFYFAQSMRRSFGNLG